VTVLASPGRPSYLAPAVGPDVLASHRFTAFGVLIRQLRNPLRLLLLATLGRIAVGPGEQGFSKLLVRVAAVLRISVFVIIIGRARRPLQR
jgi:hypothetical protein